MTATTLSIDAAITAALQPLLAAGAGPVNYLGRYAGQISASAGVDATTTGHAPALLLAWDGERGAQGFETLAGDSETTGRETWTVLCITTDSSGSNDKLGTNDGLRAAYALKDLVLGKLNNLAIDGLIRGKRLEYQAAAPVLVRRGVVYVVAVRFLSERAVDSAEPVDNSQPLEGVTANEHLVEATGAPDPIDVFSTD